MMDGNSGRLAVPEERRAIPILEDWANEHEMLRHHWALLDEYSKAKDIPNEVTLKAEECRYRQYLIHCLEATISRNGYSEDAGDFVESRIKSGTLRNPPGFDSWWKKHKAFLSQLPHHSDSGSVGGLKGQYKCFDIRCQHYAYGFETVEDQERHLNEHLHSQLSPGHASLVRSVSNPFQWRHSSELGDVEVDDDDNPPLSPEAEEFVFDPRLIRREHTVAPAASSKSLGLAHRRASPSEMSAANPCLRCKILKKGCNYQLPCSECPIQELNSSDYWKALGCFHEALVDLVGRCLPERMDKIQRICEYESHHTVTVHPYPAKEGELDQQGMAMYLLSGNSTFCKLGDECWEDISKRTDFSSRFDDAIKMAAVPGPPDKSLLRGLEIALGLLNLGYLDPVYLERTAFNPFTILRIGNELAAQPENYSTNPWALFLQAKVLLLDVISLYKQERQIYNLVAKLRFDSNPTHFPIPLPDVRRSLSKFLSYFEQSFSQRITLTAERWLDAFYAIIIFSMAKSLLIDTLSLRDDQERPTPWRASDAIQIGSVYKVIVSVFTWSAKVNSWCPRMPAKGRDPLMTHWNSDKWENIHPISIKMRKALTDTQDLTRQALWKHGAIKSSKDFLMSLGTGDFLDLGFNGFLPQRYGSKIYRKVYPKTSRTRKPIDGQSAVRDFAIFPQYSTMGIASTNATTSAATTALPMAASKSIEFYRSSEPIAAGIERSATFPQASYARETSNAVRLYTVIDSGEARQAASSGQRRYVPYNKHPDTVNTATHDHDEISGYYSAPSRTNTGHLSVPHRWDNSNEVTFTVNPGLHAAQISTQAARVNMSEEMQWHQEQPPPRLYHSQNPRSGNALIRTKSSRRDHQEQTENTRGSENTSGNNDQGSPKRICNPVEETPQQRGESVMMEMDSDVVRTAAEPQVLTSSTSVFSIRDGSSTPRPIRKILSKEQREHAARLRKLGACWACRKKKIKCDPSHLRENTSGSLL